MPSPSLATLRKLASTGRLRRWYDTVCWDWGKRLRIFVSLLLASVLPSFPALAASDQVVRGPVPAWVDQAELMSVPADASGMIFVRRQDAVIHLDQRGQQQHVGFRIKILHSNALQIGNIALSWNPAEGSPMVHAINVYRGAEVIDVLKTTSFEVLRREDQLEAARLDGVLTAVLRVPDLRVGDELEVSYTTRIGDPTLGTHDAGILFLQGAPAPGRFHLQLNWETGLEPRKKMTPDMAAVAVSKDRSLDFRFDNPPILTAPKDAPPRFQLQRLVEYSGLADWQAVSRQFAPLFAAAAKLDAGSSVKAEAARIAAANATPMARASAALRLVQQDVRYIYVGLGNGNLTPAAADVTWQRRYGDCKAKTALLLALLGELGIPAEAVLVNNSGGDDGMNERLPSPRLFDHVLVRATIDGKTWWLDGTLPPVVPPALTSAIPYRWVLPVSSQGRALEQVVWHPAARPDEINLYDIDARAGFETPAKVTTTSILRGVKGLQQQVQLSPVTPDQLLAAFRQNFVGSTWQTVDAVKWRYDEKAQASILTVSGTWTVDWEKDGGGARSLALPGGGFNPPGKRLRSAGQDQTAPYYNDPQYECMVTTIRLPAATNPDNWSTKNGFDARIFGKNYYRAFERRAGSIRMIRGFRTERIELDPATAAKDNERIAAFDNSKAYIFYDPTSRVPMIVGGKPVPATDEIDWTADDVPCLASGADGAVKVK